jgi:flagellar export protein FliJ
MKKFRFSLEALKTVRESAASKALENYARTVHAQADAEAALKAADQTVANHLQQWRKAMSRGFSPAEIISLGHSRTVLENKRNERAQALKDAAGKAQKALAEFQLAQQKSDVVERFHDRKRHEFNLSALKEEQHFLDELATTRHAAAYA